MNPYLPSEFQTFLERYPVLSAIGQTPCVRVELEGLKKPGVEIYAKLEYFNPGGSIKDRPVSWMLMKAILDGRLKPGMTVLDSSSGNAGIAYAMIGGALGYDVRIVIPGNASAERKKRLVAHGADIFYTDPVEGYDEALREVRRQAEAEPERFFFCDQYANENNWQAHYHSTAQEILDQTGGRVTHFVAGVGTGGTVTGVGRRLKQEVPGIEVTCIVPDLFPGIEGLKPLGHPEDIVPEILDESVIDHRVEVRIDDAYDYCQQLAKQGFFVGQSSGGYLKGVESVLERIDRGVVVTVFNDFGERYFSTGLWGHDSES